MNMHYATLRRNEEKKVREKYNNLSHFFILQ